MAGRRKRDSVPGGETTPGAGNPTNNPLANAGAAPVVEERIEVFPVEIPPEPHVAPSSGPGKANGRKSRSRKSIPEAVAPDDPAPVAKIEAPTPSLPPSLSDVTESLRQVVERCKEVQEQLGTVRQALKDAALEMDEMRDRSREVKQGLVEAGGLSGQVGTVRQGLQEATREMEEMHEQAQTVKQELREAGQSLGRLHQIRTVQEELQDAGRQAAGIKEQSGDVKQELQEIQTACQDLKREVSETQEKMQSLRQATLQGVAIPEPAQPVPFPPGSAEGKGEQAAKVDEHRSLIESEPHVPEMELDHPAPSPEGKKLLGLTVGPDAVVVEVLPDTPAEKAGLRVGDMVVGVDGQPIANSEDLRTAIDRADADKEVLLTVTRGQETQAISVQLSTPMELLAAAP